MTDVRDAWVREMSAQRESLVQACWARQIWARTPLRVAGGQELAVHFPGWLNRGPGPDFTDARLLLGDTEHQGDVEIHVQEQDWHDHGHQGDVRYQRVVLHVVVDRAAQAAARSLTDSPIPVLDAAAHLSPAILDALGDPEELLRRYEALPGRCGLRAAHAGPDALAPVIAHAAEERARAKAARLAPRWRPGAEEQLLFELIFQSLGYRAHAEPFLGLARRYPLVELAPLLAAPADSARRDVLTRWFGALGMLGVEGPTSGDPAAGEYEDLARRWRALGHPLLGIAASRGGTRPLNSPERRAAGMFHHLRNMGQGLLKGWLTFLKELDGLRDQPEFRRRALDRLSQAFEAPPDESWLRRTSFNAPPRARAASLVGPDRIAIVAANAIVPFFLAYARQRGDEELEKVLYRLFLVLPAEAPNSRTRFMERRLMGLTPAAPTLRTHQGLLQIHQDFCTSFDQGCARCRFPDLIAPQGGTK